MCQPTEVLIAPSLQLGGAAGLVLGQLLASVIETKLSWRW
jgi:hypothetical protein